MNSLIFMLNSVEHEIDFITLGPEMDKHTGKPHNEKIFHMLTIKAQISQHINTF